MATRNYTIQFDSNAASLITSINQLVALMNQFHEATRAANNSLKQMPDMKPLVKPAGELGDQIARIASMAGGLFGVRDAIASIGIGLKGAREESEKMGEKSFGYRDKAREYANLMGATGPTDKVMGSIFATGAASGKLFDEALKFGQEYMGAIPAAVKKGRILDRDIQAVAAEGALFGSRVGLDDATAGRLSGLVPQHINMTTDAQGRPLGQRQALERFSGQLAAMGFGLNEGIGPISSLAKAELKGVLPAIESHRVRDFAEGSAFIGVASQIASHGTGAGTRYEQLDRLLFEHKGPWGKFLKDNKIDTEPTTFGRLEKLKAVLDQRVGPGGDVQSFLAREGVSLDVEAGAGAFFYQNFDLLRQERDEAQRRSEHGAEAMAINQQYKQDPQFKHKQARLREQFSEFKVGGAMERLMTGRLNAMARIQSQGLTVDVRKRITDQILQFGGIRDWSGIPSEALKDIDAEYIHALDAAARSKGVDLVERGVLDQDMWGRRQFRHELEPMQLAEDINALERDKGVDVSGAGDNPDWEIRSMAEGRTSTISRGALTAGAAYGQGENWIQVESPDVKEAAGTIQTAGTHMVDAISELLHWLTSLPGGHDDAHPRRP